MTLSETMKQCYEARELPTWGDILNAADEIDRLSRQLAEARAEIADYRRLLGDAQDYAQELQSKLAHTAALRAEEKP